MFNSFINNSVAFGLLLPLLCVHWLPVLLVPFFVCVHYSFGRSFVFHPILFTPLWISSFFFLKIFQLTEYLVGYSIITIARYHFALQSFHHEPTEYTEHTYSHWARIVRLKFLENQHRQRANQFGLHSCAVSRYMKSAEVKLHCFFVASFTSSSLLFLHTHQKHRLDTLRDVHKR